MENVLTGQWRVKAIDMVVGRTVSLIGGLPGECVEFTQDGRYYTDIERSRTSFSRYRIEPSEGFSKLDIWIDGLEALVKRCIYRIDEDLLTICIAGNSGERPTDFYRHDNKLWCIIKMERTKVQKPIDDESNNETSELKNVIDGVFNWLKSLKANDHFEKKKQH